MADFRTCIPVLQVGSAQRSLDFYCHQLGFRRDWHHQLQPGLPFASVSRGGATLYLTEHPESTVGALVYVYVDDVEALFRELRARGVEPDLGPVEQTWGIKELHVTDPDGNKLRFGQVLRVA